MAYSNTKVTLYATVKKADHDQLIDNDEFIKINLLNIKADKSLRELFLNYKKLTPKS